MDDTRQPDPVAPTHEQEREEQDPRGTQRSEQLPEDVPDGGGPEREDASGDES